MATLLRDYQRASDAEMVELTEVDLRVQMVLDVSFFSFVYSEEHLGD